MQDTFFESHFPKTSRENEIKQLLSFIKQGNSCQLISLPGTGRSTLLGMLAYNSDIRTYHLNHDTAAYHFVMVEFSEISQQPVSQALKLIFLDIVSSLEKRHLENTYETVKSLFEHALSSHDDLVLFQSLKKTIDFLTLEKKLKVVLLFDKFDTYIPMLNANFFRHLASLRSHAREKFTIIFSLYKPLEYFLDEQMFKDFAEYVENHTVYLSFKDETSLTFQIEIIEKTLGKKLTELDKKMVLSLTNGHSKLTRLCVQKVLETSSPDADSLLKTSSIHKTLETMWHILNPAEQTHFLKSLYPNVLADEHSHYLQAVGLMSETAITLPLFEKYLQKKKQDYEKENRTIVLNDSTSVIKKGEQNLSDSLTATEFRLLRFFVQNPSTVLERNAIISGVWKDTKTVLGVSDQALDQLIFRLRRKIEEDPNKPMHLQTVKGRGFIFTP